MILDANNHTLMQIKNKINNQLINKWNCEIGKINYYCDILKPDIPKQIIDRKMELLTNIMEKNKLIVSNKMNNNRLLYDTYMDKINIYNGFLNSGVCYIRYGDKIVKNAKEFKKLINNDGISIVFNDGVIDIKNYTVV